MFGNCGVVHRCSCKNGLPHLHRKVFHHWAEYKSDSGLVFPYLITFWKQTWWLHINTYQCHQPNGAIGAVSECLVENKNLLSFNWETVHYSGCFTHLRKDISLRLVIDQSYQKVTFHGLPIPHPLVSWVINSLAPGLTVSCSLQLKGSSARMTLLNLLCRALWMWVSVS